MEGILSESYGEFGRLRPVRVPGLRFEYNNGNYLVLELWTEEVTQETFASYMQQTIFDPLGMTSSTYAPAQPLTATPYDADKRPLPQNHAAVGVASGGLYTTAADLARFVAAAMHGHDGSKPGKGILSPETAAQAIAPAIETGGRYGLGCKINSDVGGTIVADLVCTWADWEREIELTGLCRGTEPIPAQ